MSQKPPSSSKKMDRRQCLALMGEYGLGTALGFFLPFLKTKTAYAQFANASFYKRHKIFCALSGSGASPSTVAATSLDGAHWNTHALPSGAWTCLAWNGVIFCALSDGSNTAYLSSDGVTWNPSSTIPSIPSTWSKLIWTGSSFFALGAGTDDIYISPDGKTWSTGTLPTSQNWGPIGWNGSILCAIGATNTNNFATSTDGGTTWTSRTLPVSGYWKAIAWNGTTFCLIALSNSNTLTSPDGINWTAHGSALPLDASNNSRNWFDIAWNGSLFCAISGTGSNIAVTSPDGINWTQHTLPASAYWSSLSWNGSVFCAIASSSSTIAATSPDGIIWTPQTLPSPQYWNVVVSS